MSDDIIIYGKTKAEHGRDPGKRLHAYEREEHHTESSEREEHHTESSEREEHHTESSEKEEHHTESQQV